MTVRVFSSYSFISLKVLALADLSSVSIRTLSDYRIKALLFYFSYFWLFSKLS